MKQSIQNALDDITTTLKVGAIVCSMWGAYDLATHMQYVGPTHASAAELPKTMQTHAPLNASDLKIPPIVLIDEHELDKKLNEKPKHKGK